MLAFPSRLLSAPPPPSAARSSLFLAATATATATATTTSPRMMSTTNLPNHNSAQPILVNDGNNNNNLAQVLQYHHQTKHSFSNYARGPRGLDWANQPNPFRRYSPAPLLPLLHPDSSSSAAYPAVFLSPRPSPPAPLSLAAISQLFYDSLALSAWKSTGFSTWSLRVNPSSGNLHPTEAYLVSPAIPSLSDSPFVAHYAPKEHSLELRAVASAPVADFFPRFFPAGSFLVGLSSIFWRESWKYGERAFRYCNHDVGHAIAAVAFAAASLGWDVRLLDGLGFKDLERIMGLELQNAQFEIPSKPVKGSFRELEFEHPDCLLLVSPSSSPDFSINYAALSSAIAEYSTSLKWQGKPNSLSKDHVCWDIIYRTAEAAKKPLTAELRFSVTPFQSIPMISSSSYKNLTVREVVRKRRSAVDMDGVHVMERETFYQILLHCLPSVARDGEKLGKPPLAFPFRVLPWNAEIHFVLFVHRVKDLSKGVYFLVRNEDHLERLRRATRSDFEWEKPDGCPDDLPLYRLAKGDCQKIAKQLSCHQDIAGDGCFSLGMIARFEPTLSEKNAWMYPRLFWETGVLGQVLYLEAHAVGISATGIGCYFDDGVHEVLGLKGAEFQSLYHFTVGGPVVDKRIMSLPAYPGPNIDA